MLDLHLEYGSIATFRLSLDELMISFSASPTYPSYTSNTIASRFITTLCDARISDSSTAQTMFYKSRFVPAIRGAFK